MGAITPFHFPNNIPSFFLPNKWGAPWTSPDNCSHFGLLGQTVLDYFFAFFSNQCNDVPSLYTLLDLTTGQLDSEVDHKGGTISPGPLVRQYYRWSANTIDARSQINIEHLTATTHNGEQDFHETSYKHFDLVQIHIETSLKDCSVFTNCCNAAWTKFWILQQYIAGQIHTRRLLNHKFPLQLPNLNKLLLVWENTVENPNYAAFSDWFACL